MQIGETAQRSGVPARTIRYYEAIGVLQPPRRFPNGYRNYDDTAVDRLAFIRTAQASGLTLGEIRGVLGFRDRGETPCHHVRTLIDQRAAELDQQIRELKEMRAELSRLAERARHLDPSDCDPGEICHIIARPA